MIDAQSRAALSMEEVQAKLTLMCIDTTFADACDRMRAHERGLVNWKHIDRTVLSLISACMVRSEGTCLSASKDRQDHILWFCRRTRMACSLPSHPAAGLMFRRKYSACAAHDVL